MAHKVEPRPCNVTACTFERALAQINLHTAICQKLTRRFAISIDSDAGEVLPSLFGRQGFAWVRRPEELPHRLPDPPAPPDPRALAAPQQVPPAQLQDEIDGALGRIDLFNTQQVAMPKLSNLPQHLYFPA